jgi:hypothetical protein
MTIPRPSASRRYDPWGDLAARWPDVQVVHAPMSGRLLGELRYPTITLRASSSSAQLRCTLAHEIVHLDRGIGECGPWAAREEAAVHAEAARRLIDLGELVEAARVLGDDAGAGAMAGALDVDTETLVTRIQGLTRRERAVVNDVLSERPVR